MKKQVVILLSLIFSVSSFAFAQTRTVTNQDLEKFRQQRLQAEREYSRNYKEMGFPSPEELKQKRAEDQKELIEFSRQLETQRLTREAAAAEAENRALQMQNQHLRFLVENSVNQSNNYTESYLPYNYGYILPYNYGYYGGYDPRYYPGYYGRRGYGGFFNLQFGRFPQLTRSPQSLGSRRFVRPPSVKIIVP